MLDSNCFVLGSEVESFEHKFATFCRAKHCVGVGSGLAALHLMMLAAGIGPGDQVIVASNSYIATVLAVIATGATPVFVEPDISTYNLDPGKVHLAITSATKAILSTDMYGQPADVPALPACALPFNQTEVAAAHAQTRSHINHMSLSILRMPTDGRPCQGCGWKQYSLVV